MKIPDDIEEVVKDAYDDLGHPVAKPTGELIGLVPRAIKAALAPLEQWIMRKEFNIAETKKLLDEKLKNVNPKLILPPEPHIAVPALQYISYCMDNKELRDMYANLLANSMNKTIKNGVHPGFVEIIKQLCPDEAKILKYIYMNRYRIPTVDVRYEKDDGSGFEALKNFSNLGEVIGCEIPFDIDKYFDNLNRLGLIEHAVFMASLTDKKYYEPLRNHKRVLETINDAQKTPFKNAKIVESFVSLTSYGTSFCYVCLSTSNQ